MADEVRGEMKVEPVQLYCHWKRGGVPSFYEKGDSSSMFVVTQLSSTPTVEADKYVDTLVLLVRRHLTSVSLRLRRNVSQQTPNL